MSLRKTSKLQSFILTKFGEGRLLLSFISFVKQTVLKLEKNFILLRASKISKKWNIIVRYFTAFIEDELFFDKAI